MSISDPHFVCADGLARAAENFATERALIDACRVQTANLDRTDLVAVIMLLTVALSVGLEDPTELRAARAKLADFAERCTL